jgi:hypothetical protein
LQGNLSCKSLLLLLVLQNAPIIQIEVRPSLLPHVLQKVLYSSEAIWVVQKIRQIDMQIVE